MQENEKLVLGIDLCDDITQVTVMRPHAAEPDAVCFDARTRKEFLPTVLWKSTEEEWQRLLAMMKKGKGGSGYEEQETK